MAGNLAFMSGSLVWAAATQGMTLDHLAQVARALAFLGSTRLQLYHPPQGTAQTKAHP